MKTQDAIHARRLVSLVLKVIGPSGMHTLYPKNTASLVEMESRYKENGYSTERVISQTKRE